MEKKKKSWNEVPHSTCNDSKQIPVSVGRLNVIYLKVCLMFAAFFIDIQSIQHSVSCFSSCLYLMNYESNITNAVIVYINERY